MRNLPAIKLFLLILVTMTFGCKQGGPAESPSAVQSLDNLTRSAGTAIVENSCGVVMTEERFERLSAKNKKKLERINAANRDHFLAAAGTLLAVPKPIQTMLYKFDGKITVAEDSARLCRSVALTKNEQRFVTENSDRLESCWKRGKNNKVEVILPADSDKIRHNLLRMFAYLYYEYFFESIKNGGEKVLQDGIQRFEAQLTDLAAALLTDLASGDQKVFEGFVALDQKAPEVFKKFVFAGAMDSYYCSLESRQVLASDFPKTMNSFLYSGSGDKESLAKDFGKAHFE